jgi:two-component system sensor histidine kinase CpxA
MFDAPPARVVMPERLPMGDSPLFLPKSRPVFLVRGDHGDGYWAGVMLHLPSSGNRPLQQPLLLIHAKHLDGSGMFFDINPWLWGGLAVLLLSLAFWTPFVWGITRYLHRLTVAADRIAGGQFQVSLPPRGNDELGNLGRTIESMAARLDLLITGQKRFLGDAAHELCAPLARIRTGLGILEMKLADADLAALSSIEADTAELAALVEEILAFSRAGNRAPALRATALEPLVRELLAREAVAAEVAVTIPPDLGVVTDPSLLGRALGNLIRNAFVHAGPRAKVSVIAAETVDTVTITVTDDGPGVPPAELPRLFEPFYRLDRSRSRDTGGLGLGLAIVRTAIQSCGGDTVATLPETGGFAVTITLPKQPAVTLCRPPDKP